MDEINKKYGLNLDKNFNVDLKIIKDILENGNLSYNNNTDEYLFLYGYYCLLKHYDEMMLRYWNECENSRTTLYLGKYYYDKCNYEKMKKYYLKSINFGNSEAMNNLGYYYQHKEHNPVKMEYFYKQAIILGNVEAMFNYGYYFYLNKQYNNMKLYFLMAIELNHIDAMFNLAYYYEYKEKNDEKMRKYYLLGIENNSIQCLTRFEWIFQKNIEIKHFLLKKCESIIAINKIKELEKINFNGIKIFKELIEYCFNPQRLLKLCDYYDIELYEYIDIV